MADKKPATGKPSKQKKPIDTEDAALKAQQKDTYELVRMRNNFYRDSYRRLVLIMFLLLVTVVLSLSTVFYLASHRPKPKYFATNVYGGIVPLKPLNQPSVSNEELLQWSARAASSSAALCCPRKSPWGGAYLRAAL